MLLAASVPGRPLQIAVESADWAIIDHDNLITTAYRKEADGVSFIVQRARLGWRLSEVPIDDEVRGLFLRLLYAKLAPR